MASKFCHIEAKSVIQKTFAVMFLALSPLLLFSLWALLGYLCGSLPFGFWISRLSTPGDIRSHGSQSTGATNVLRTIGKGAALLTLLLDTLKGFLPLTFALLWSDISDIAWLSFFPVLGHVFPLFLQFKGGKGVATTLGVLLALSPPLAVGLFLFWLGMLSITRIVSLASLSTALLAPLACFLGGTSVLGFVTIVLSLLLFWTHRTNLLRLWSGTESRIGSSSRVI